MAEFFDKVPPEIYIAPELMARLQELMGLSVAPIQIMRADSCVVSKLHKLLGMMNITKNWPYSKYPYVGSHPFFWSALIHEVPPKYPSVYFKWFHKIATSVRLDKHLLVKTATGLRVISDDKKGLIPIIRYYGPHVKLLNDENFNMFIPPKPAIHLRENISDLLQILDKQVLKNVFCFGKECPESIIRQFKMVFMAPDRSVSVSIYDPFNTFSQLLMALKSLYFFSGGPIDTKFIKTEERSANYICVAETMPITPATAIAFYSSFFLSNLTIPTPSC